VDGKLWSLLLVKLALKVAAALGRSRDAVLKEVNCLGLEDDDTLKFSLSSSSKLDREGWLRSVEEAFMMLNAGNKKPSFARGTYIYTSLNMNTHAR